MESPSRYNRQHQAFSLLELAVSLVIVGLMSGLYLKLSATTDRNECYTSSKAQVEKVKQAVDRFAISNRRFPLPARRYVGVDSNVYGKEASIADLDSLVANNNGTPGDPTDDPIAVFGAVPHATLGMAMDDSIDCWGNKLTYVVTKALTDTTTFANNTPGAITVEVKSGTTYSDKIGYAVIVHGEDQLGAAKANFNDLSATTPDQRKWCAADGSPKTANCNVTSSFRLAAPFNNGDNPAKYFDDVIIFRGKPWKAESGGKVYCWGRNTYGRLGIDVAGGGPDVGRPTLVEGDISFTAVTLGDWHTCGLDAAKKAYCWGNNSRGQLGIGFVGGTDRLVPTPVVGPDIAGVPQPPLTFSKITLGAVQTCGIAQPSGHAYCWGDRSNPEFGANGGGFVPKPTQVAGPSGTVADALVFKEITSNLGRTCALTVAGRPYCWGRPIGPQEMYCLTGPLIPPFNAWPPFPFDSYIPKPLPGPGGTTAPGDFYTFKSLNANGYLGTVCGLDMGDKAHCLGSTAYGQLGKGTVTPPSPLWTCDPLFSAVLGPDGGIFSSIAVGAYHTCGLKGNKAYCWGANTSGQLGRDTVDVFPNYYNNTLPPVDPVVGADGNVASSFDFKVITAGLAHTCALTPTGKAYCWGNNNFLQLGSGLPATNALPRPQEVVGPDGTAATALNFKTIQTGYGYGYTCAIVGTP